MKKFDKNGIEIGLPDSLTWEDRYYLLEKEFELLWTDYQKLINETSWRRDTTRWGA